MIHSIRNWNANAACVHVVIGCKKARVLPFRRLIMSRMQSQRRQVKFRWTQFTLVERKGKSMSMILIMCAVSPPVLHPEVVPSKNCDSRLLGWSPKSSQTFWQLPRVESRRFHHGPWRGHHTRTRLYTQGHRTCSNYVPGKKRSFLESNDELFMSRGKCVSTECESLRPRSGSIFDRSVRTVVIFFFLVFYVARDVVSLNMMNW